MERFIGENIIPKHPGNKMGSYTVGNKMYIIIAGRVTCGDIRFTLPKNTKNFGKIYTYIVDGSLKVGDNMCLWFEPYDLNEKSVEFTFSSDKTGAVWFCLDTDVCYHGNEIGDSFSLMYGLGKAWVRNDIFAEFVHSSYRVIRSRYVRFYRTYVNGCTTDCSIVVEWFSTGYDAFCGNQII
jgi:hypothetical protein